jgi:type I restriction enzyme, S subunit
MHLRKLSDVCEIIMGQSPDSSSYNENGEGLPFFQGKADFGELYPIPRMYCSKPSKIAITNDILISVRAPVGDVNIATEECCIGRGVAAIRSKENINFKYLYYVLEFMREKIASLGTGSTFKAISKAPLSTIEIPVPPLEQQIKIVNLVDKVKEVIIKRRSQIAALDELTKSVFLAMFGDPRSKNSKFEKKQLSDFGEIITGNTPPRDVKEYYGDHIEWIKSDNINTPYHFLTKAEEYLSEKGMEKGRVVPKNSILITCIAGSKSCIGNAAIADREVAFNQQINAIIPKGNPFFLYTQFLVGKELVQSASTDGMKGLVSKGAFRKIGFISPPDKLQGEFGNKFLVIQNQKQQLLESLQNIEGLYHSLLQKSFKGELFQ